MGCDGSWISVKAVKVQHRSSYTPNSSELAVVRFVVVDFWRQLIPATEMFLLFNSCTTDHCITKSSSLPCSLVAIVGYI